MLTPLGKRRPRIFISYRRDDSEASTDLLLEQLVAHFGKKHIFLDVDDVSVGEDFVRAIERAVGSCDVLLAVIGKHWLTLMSAHGRRRRAAADFVRLEIVTALGRDILVIPVLVQGADMPRAEDLPDDLKPLAHRQAFVISRARRREDAARLIKKIEKATAQRAGPSAPRYISPALTFIILLVLTAGAWRLYNMRTGDEGGPALDATSTAAPTAAPTETPAPALETTPTPTPEPEPASPETPHPAPSDTPIEPALETITLPPEPTPQQTPTPPSSPPVQSRMGDPTPTPGPDLLTFDNLLFPEPSPTPGRLIDAPVPERPGAWRPPWERDLVLSPVSRPTPTPWPAEVWAEERRREERLKEFMRKQRQPPEPGPRRRP